MVTTYTIVGIEAGSIKVNSLNGWSYWCWGFGRERLDKDVYNLSKWMWLLAKGNRENEGTLVDSCRHVCLNISWLLRVPNHWTRRRASARPVATRCSSCTGRESYSTRLIPSGTPKLLSALAVVTSLLVCVCVFVCTYVCVYVFFCRSQVGYDWHTHSKQAPRLLQPREVSMCMYVCTCMHVLDVDGGSCDSHVILLLQVPATGTIQWPSDLEGHYWEKM